ncbi:MAG: YciI family protein [Xanthobacteraceae bacterium]|jgi:hypothetical protein
MRVMYFVRSKSTTFPPARLMEEIGNLAERHRQASHVVDLGGALTPMADGAVVKLSGGKVHVIDGPFAEAKEVVGGYAIFDFPTREQALASAVEFMNLHRDHGEGWEGECEMRPFMEAPPH